MFTTQLSFITQAPIPSRRKQLQEQKCSTRRQTFVAPTCKKDKSSKSLPAGKGFARPKGVDANKMGFVGSETIGISFTCNADGCNQRVAKKVKRRTYEKGTLLIQCPKCKKHHVIADNMGMYKHLTGGLKNVEEMAKNKGDNVTRVDSSVFELEKLISAVEAEDTEEEDGAPKTSEE